MANEITGITGTGENQIVDCQVCGTTILGNVFCCETCNLLECKDCIKIDEGDGHIVNEIVRNVIDDKMVNEMNNVQI